MLTPKNTRNKVIDECQRSPWTLSVFRLSGHPSGSVKDYWMSDAELRSASVHVMINCIEVGPYLEHFQRLNVGDTYTNFPEWFEDQVKSLSYLQENDGGRWTQGENF
jgi:hypothetical protein